MKINKYDTLAFSISIKSEENAQRDFRERLGDSVGNIEVDRIYLPLIRFKAIKQEILGKGLKTGIGNYFYVNLVDCGLYHTHKKGILEISQENTKNFLIKLFSKTLEEKEAKTTRLLEKFDILNRVFELPTDVLDAVGYLQEFGTAPYNELNPGIVNTLKEMGLVKIFSPQEGQLYTFIQTVFSVTPRQSYTKYYVKPSFHIPKFPSRGYDLMSLFEVSDTAEDYPKEKVRYAPEKISILLKSLFRCVIVPDTIMYMPYLICKSKREGQYLQDFYPVPCLKNQKSEIKGYQRPIKLQPITIATKGEGLDSTLIESVAVNFSHVIGMDKVKDIIRNTIIYPLTHPELSKEFGEKSGGSILFYGPPGCGKTYIAKATVGECGYSFFNVDIGDILKDDPLFGAKNLHEMFVQARKNSPAVLFFDEIDALGGRRDTSKAGAEKIIITQFLTEMDGVESSNENVLVIGSTNAPWDIDPALRRAGRFTLHIFIPSPDKTAREGIFKLYMKERPVSSDVNFEKLAELTEGFSSADIQAICDEASKIPWSEAVHTGIKRKITIDDFITVLINREPSIVPWFILAEKQIEKSGEKEIYTDLCNAIQEFKSRQKLRITEKEISEILKQKPIVRDDKSTKKSLIERKIQILKDKLQKGEIDGNTYVDILRDYEEQLMSLESSSEK